MKFVLEVNLEAPDLDDSTVFKRAVVEHLGSALSVIPDGVSMSSVVDGPNTGQFAAGVKATLLAESFAMKKDEHGLLVKDESQSGFQVIITTAPYERLAPHIPEYAREIAYVHNIEVRSPAPR